MQDTLYGFKEQIIENATSNYCAGFIQKVILTYFRDA